VEDSEDVELGVAPTGAGVPEGVRVPVGDAGVEGDSEGYAEWVEVVEGDTPAVRLEVGVFEGVRVPVVLGVWEGVEESEGVVEGVEEAEAPGVREEVSEPETVVEGVLEVVRVGVPVVERLAVRV